MQICTAVKEAENCQLLSFRDLLQVDAGISGRDQWWNDRSTSSLEVSFALLPLLRVGSIVVATIAARASSELVIYPA